MKEKPILASLREKKRYLVFEVVSDKDLRLNEVNTSICDELLRFLGEFGCAKAGIIILNEWKNNKGVMKVGHKFVDEVRSALTLIKEINGNNVIIKTISSSGILNKAMKKMEE